MAWWSDRIRKRGPFLAIFTLFTVIGYIILIACANLGKPGVLYFATYLVATGLYVAVGLNITYPPLLPNTTNQKMAWRKRRPTLQAFHGNRLPADSGEHSGCRGGANLR